MKQEREVLVGQEKQRETEAGWCRPEGLESWARKVAFTVCASETPGSRLPLALPPHPLALPAELARGDLMTWRPTLGAR